MANPYDPREPSREIQIQTLLDMTADHHEEVAAQQHADASYNNDFLAAQTHLLWAITKRLARAEEEGRG